MNTPLQTLRIRATLTNSSGLHARAAAAFVREIKNLDVAVRVSWKENEANGHSVLDLLTLGAPAGSEIEIIITGGDSQRAASQLTALVNSRFHEA